MDKNQNQGFTLIELMIVIIVVAILATFILVGLAGARNAAEDSRRRGAVTQIRSFSSVHYSIKGNYFGLEGAEELTEILRKYDEVTGEDKVLKIIVSSSGSDFCAEIELKEGDYFCTDGSYRIVDDYIESRCTSESTNCDPVI